MSIPALKKYAYTLSDYAYMWHGEPQYEPNYRLYKPYL